MASSAKGLTFIDLVWVAGIDVVAMRPAAGVGGVGNGDSLALLAYVAVADEDRSTRKLPALAAVSSACGRRSAVWSLWCFDCGL